ncbi:Uncharacterised protein [Proteus mirabilis]|uniref:Uncharacterized protein n=1 Tax=Proteus mirabilis TaxID=584 RepID=A0A2X2E6S0_PROMI|nr:Uncharacterised protein [Proteus mirabilis]
MINNQKAYLAQERLFLIDKFGPLLFFLIPLIMLIIGGKSWAKYVAFSVSGDRTDLYRGVLPSKKILFVIYTPK